MDYLRIAAASFSIRTADVAYNAAAIIECIEAAKSRGVQALVLPELCLSGACCGALFQHESLLNASERALKSIIDHTADSSMLIALGMPRRMAGGVYSMAVIIQSGKELCAVPNSDTSCPFGFVPKTTANAETLLFEALRTNNAPSPAKFALEGGYSLEIDFASLIFSNPQSRFASVHERANVRLILSSFNSLNYSEDYLMDKIKLYSREHNSAIAYSSTCGDSVTDYAFDGVCLVAERGEIRTISATQLKGINLQVTDVDLAQMRPYESCMAHAIEMPALKDPAPFISRTPWLSPDESVARRQAMRIIDLQARALAQRASKIGVKGFVVGVSGGLDSAMALLACVRACEMLAWNTKNVLGISMPGLGTSDRTHDNSRALCEGLNVSFRDICITQAVRTHFVDIGHDESDHSTTFENAQARERTQILLDIANKENLLDVGTGDYSEIALGWCTFGGDHMSQFGVNSSLLKSQIRNIISFAREKYISVSKVLLDILETPVSPELLPVKNGQISQKTEETIGPYDIQDFFIYHWMHNLMTIEQLIERAHMAFSSQYDIGFIRARARLFIERFVNNQYKRNCMPEGPNLTGFSLSCRSFSLASDAYSSAFIEIV